MNVTAQLNLFLKGKLAGLVPPMVIGKTQSKTDADVMLASYTEQAHSYGLHIKNKKAFQ